MDDDDGGDAGSAVLDGMSKKERNRERKRQLRLQRKEEERTTYGLGSLCDIVADAWAGVSE